jgi:hypothetical protein
MVITPESKLSQEVLSWRDISMDSVQGTETPKDPRRRVVSKLEMPKACIEHPYFESHELAPPAEETVPDRYAFGTHWGLVFFFGDDPIKMRDLLKSMEELDFYV